jgi:hypothetical protein
MNNSGYSLPEYLSPPSPKDIEMAYKNKNNKLNSKSFSNFETLIIGFKL